MANQESVRLRQEGTRVHVIKDGTLVLDLPWGAALEIAKSMHKIAKMAETEQDIQQVLDDQALLTATGAPIGLSDNPKLLKESYKRAQELKYPQVEISSIVGTPTIIRRPVAGVVSVPQKIVLGETVFGENVTGMG